MNTNVYVKINKNNQPDAIKVIGATEKRVKCSYIGNKDVMICEGGGTCHIDVDDVVDRIDFLGTLHGNYVSYKGNYYFELNSRDEIFTWTND